MWNPASLSQGTSPTILWFSAALCLAWWLMLEAWNSRNSRILGSGPDEYKRVAAASLWLFGLVAIFSYVFRVETARGYVGIALPVGLTRTHHRSLAPQTAPQCEPPSGASMSRLHACGRSQRCRPFGVEPRRGQARRISSDCGVYTRGPGRPRDGTRIWSAQSWAINQKPQRSWRLLTVAKPMPSRFRPAFSCIPKPYGTLGGSWRRGTLD